ncbi:MAG: type III secretion system chaperone [Candidatus Adiutrix sp.]|jgi:hypothetical protein|nr:type III secretion system chaperone [Candidatus Adiutrix sp.]
MSQSFQPFVKALSQTLGVELEAPSDGALFLPQEEGAILIQWLEAGRRILFYAEVGQPTVFRRGEVFASLLEANLFLSKTHGAALSFDAGSNMVGLNLLLPFDGLSPEDFINAADNLVSAAATWREELSRLNGQAEEETIRQQQAVLNEREANAAAAATQFRA